MLSCGANCEHIFVNSKTALHLISSEYSKTESEENRMYQKHEIVIRLNSELMNKMKAVEDDAFEAGKDPDDAIGNAFSDDELTIISQTQNALSFVTDHIAFYTDALDALEPFSYCGDNTVYGQKEDPRPYVEYQISRTEENDTLRIRLEEFWNGRFQLEGVNPLLNPAWNIDLVPRFVGVIWEQLKGLKYLQNTYSELRESFGDMLQYDCVSRMYDECPNGDGAIGVYEKAQNRFKVYGYGMASYGWSGDLLEENKIDCSIFAENPDKLWHVTNPRFYWNLLDAPTEDDFYSDNAEAMFADFPEKFDEMIKESVNDDSQEGDIAYEYEMYYLWDEDETQLPEHPERVNAVLSGQEITLLIKALTTATKQFIKTQKQLCDNLNIPYEENVNNECCVQLLMHSDDNELVYIAADNLDDTGIKTGDLSIYYKQL